MEQTIVFVKSAGVNVTTTYDVTMFNLTTLFRDNFQSSSTDPDFWRVALRSFIVTPTMRGIHTLLRRETTGHLEITLTKRCSDSSVEVCEHNADLWIHSGLLPCALLELRLLDDGSIVEFYNELRDLVSDTVSRFYSPDRRLIIPPVEMRDVASESTINKYGAVVDRIIDLANIGKITLGGSWSLESTSTVPTPWLTADSVQVRSKKTSSSPCTEGVITNFSVIKYNPLLCDSKMILNISLNVIYTALSIVLAKRVVLHAHCAEMGLVDDRQNLTTVEQFDSLSMSTPWYADGRPVSPIEIMHLPNDSSEDAICCQSVMERAVSSLLTDTNE